MEILKKELVKYNKRYTMKVTSWENDGDLYRTKEIHLDSKEKMLALYEILTILFKDRNYNSGVMDGVSNTESVPTEYIFGWILENEQLHVLFTDHITMEEHDADSILQILINDISYPCMGCSDFYQFRVCESVEVFMNDESGLTYKLTIG